MTDFSTLISGIVNSLKLPDDWNEPDLSLQACSKGERLKQVLEALHEWKGSDQPTDVILEKMKKKDIATHIADNFFSEADRGIFNDSISKDDGEFWQKNNATLKVSFWNSLSRGLNNDGVEKAKLNSSHYLRNWEDLIVERTKDDGLPEYCLDIGNGPKPIKITKIQRPTRWTPNQMSGFIRSLRGGNPIPSMTAFQENDDSPIEIMDGQQRLTVAFDRPGQWRGQLPEHSPEAIVTLLTPAEGVAIEEAREELVRIFRVLNTGGTNLKPLEVIIASYIQSANRYLFEELLELSNLILLEETGKTPPWMKEVKSCTKNGKRSILDSDTLTSREIELIDILLRPLVYGTLKKPGIMTSALCSGRTTMRGIEKVIQSVGSAEHAGKIRHRLTRAFEVASEVFPAEGEFSFLRMPKRSKDQEAQIDWNTRSALKTAAALQVGSIYAYLPLSAEIEEEVQEEIRTAWREFVNPGDGGETEHFLDEFFIPRSQNTTSLWGWQNSWSEKVRGILIDAGIDIAKEKRGEEPTPSWVDIYVKLLPASKIEEYREQLELYNSVKDVSDLEELKIRALKRLIQKKE